MNFNEPQKRTPDDQVKARYAPPDPNAPARAGGGGRGGPEAAADAAARRGRADA